MGLPYLRNNENGSVRWTKEWTRAKLAALWREARILTVAKVVNGKLQIQAAVML